MHSVISNAESVLLTEKSMASIGRIGCGAYSTLTASAVSNSMNTGGRCDMVITSSDGVRGEFSK